MRGSRSRTPGKALLLALAGVLSVVPAAWGHAVLVDASPSPGSVLASPPKALRLTFGEGLLVSASRVTLSAQDGTRIPVEMRGDPADPRVLLLSIPALGDGLYTVVWRAASSVDGHVTKGSFTFRVGGLAGRPLRLDPAEGPQPRPLRAETVVLRWTAFVASVVLAGGAFVQAAIFRGRETPLRVAAGRRMFIAAVPAALVMAVASLWEMGIGAAAESRTLQFALGLRLGAVVASLAALWADARGRERLVPAVAPFALVWLGFSLTSHAAAEESLVLLSVDWLHRMAAAAWVGGLFYLAAVLRPAMRALEPGERIGQTAAVGRRFSTLAAAALGTVVLTGVYEAVYHLPRPGQLVDIAYGRLLLIKLCVVGVLVALGALNRFRWLPALARARTGQPSAAGGRAAGGFFRTVGAEFAAGAAVLLLASVVGQLPTGRQVLADQARRAELRLAGVLGETRVALVITPFEVGRNIFVVDLRPARLPPDQTVVRLRFLYLEDDAGPVVAGAVPESDGRFVFTGDALSRPGLWLVEVILRRRGLHDAVAGFPVDPGPPRVAGLEGASDPRAVAVLRDAVAAMRAVRSMRMTELLSDGAGGSVLSSLDFVRPGRLRVRSNGSTIAIVGADRFVMEDGRWKSAGRALPITLEGLLYVEEVQEVKNGPREIVDGRAAQVVTFAAPGYNARFALWIESETRRVLRQVMLAEAHHMDRAFFDFDVPVPAGWPDR